MGSSVGTIVDDLASAWAIATRRHSPPGSVVRHAQPVDESDLFQCCGGLQSPRRAHPACSGAGHVVQYLLVLGQEVSWNACPIADDRSPVSSGTASYLPGPAVIRLLHSHGTFVLWREALWS